MVTCASHNDNAKPFPLKQNLTCANYGGYVATYNVVRYTINNMLAKQ